MQVSHVNLKTIYYKRIEWAHLPQRKSACRENHHPEMNLLHSERNLNFGVRTSSVDYPTHVIGIPCYI